MGIDRMTLAYARRALREVHHRIYEPNMTLIDFGHGLPRGAGLVAKRCQAFRVDIESE